MVLSWFRERVDISRMAILEPSLDLFCLALKAVDMSPLIQAKNVHFFVGDIDLENFEKEIGRAATLGDTHILRHVPSFQWKSKLYQELNDRAFSIINYLNVQGGTTRSSGLAFFKNRLANFTLLPHSANLDLLKDTFKGKPAVVVAAGPSLDQTLPDLKATRGQAVIIAADSALAPLLKAGIMPDFVTTIDFQEANFEKIASFLGKEWPFSLISMIKGTPLIPKRFAAKHLFLQFPEDRPHSWVVDTLGINTLVSFGGSVAHLSLGIAQMIGADPVIFVGQDLSYPGKSAVDHAGGTVFSSTGFPRDREKFFVPGVRGDKVLTDRQFMSLQKQFEDMIADNPRTYINATPFGAHIAGTEAVSFTESAARYFAGDIAVASQVDEAVKNGPQFPVGAFVKKGEDILAEIKKMRGLIQESTSLEKLAVRELKKLQKKKNVPQGLDSLPQHLIQQLARFDGVNNLLDQNPVWEHLLEVTFQSLDENDQRREKNESIRNSDGYLPWLLAELGRISRVNHERDKALHMYFQELGKLVDFLTEEERLKSVDHSSMADGDLFSLVQLYLSAGDMLRAKEIFDKAGESLSGGEATLLKGECEAGLLQLAKAQKSWQKAIESDHAVAGRVLENRKKNAEFWIHFAVQKGRDYPVLLGQWLKRVSLLLPEDLSLPDSLVALWQEHAEIISASLEKGQANFKTALLEAWLPFCEKIPQLNYFQARLAGMNDDLPSALEFLKHALEKEPGNGEWLMWLARFTMESGDFVTGMDYLHQAVACDPQTAVMWEELGDVLASGGDQEGAILAYERCFVALPERLSALVKIGDAHVRNGQLGAAEAAYAAASEKEPHNPQFRVKLEKLRKEMHIT